MGKLRWILVLSLVLASVLPSFAQTAFVSADLKTVLGSSLQGDSFVRFRLRNYSGNVPHLAGASGVIVSSDQDVYPDASGHVATSLYRNDFISPNGTFYTVEYWSGGLLYSSANYLITTSTADLNTKTPITAAPVIPPVIPTPTDQVYVRIDGGNSPFTGPIAVPALNSIRFADQFVTIQAAINDAGSSGSVIIPGSYSGTDTWTNPNGVAVLDMRPQPVNTYPSNGQPTAGNNNTPGNTFFGVLSGSNAGANAIPSGPAIYETGFGWGALASLTSGEKNSAFGWMAGFSVTTGRGNTALGMNSLPLATTPDYNTAVGGDAMFHTSTGYHNTCVGLHCMWTNTTGFQNNTLGLDSLFSNTSGSQNVAIGTEALRNNTTASNNTAVGFQSLRGNTTGQFNTAIGQGALYNNLAANNNTAIGYFAMNIGGGDSNTAIGFGAAQQSVTATQNVAVGVNALNANQVGVQNVAVGMSALFSATASNNVGVGFQSLTGTTTGQLNTAIGHQSGLTNTTGSNNTFVGSQADAVSNNLDHATAIGAGAQVNGSNTVVIGRGADAIQIPGTVKVGASGSTISDSRELVQSAHSCGTTTSCANTANGAVKEVYGKVALSTGTATITGITGFSSSSTFGCVGTDQSAVAAVQVTPASASSITIAGTGSDVIFYRCIGN